MDWGVRIPEYRHENWNPDTLLAEVRGGSTVTSVIKKYTLPDQSISTLIKDIRQWKKQSPGFHAEYRKVLKQAGLDRGVRVHGVESRKLVQSGEWKQQFIRAYILTGNKEEAAKYCPASSSTIARRLDQNSKYYDEEFARLVEEAEDQISAEAEALVVEAFRDPGATLQQRANIALKWLQSRDSKRWGQKSEQTIKGEVQHKHVLGEKERAIANLWEDQQAFFNRPAEKLLTGGSATGDLAGSRPSVDRRSAAPRVANGGVDGESGGEGEEEGSDYYGYERPSDSSVSRRGEHGEQGASGGSDQRYPEDPDSDVIDAEIVGEDD